MVEHMGEAWLKHFDSWLSESVFCTINWSTKNGNLTHNASPSPWPHPSSNHLLSHFVVTGSTFERGSVNQTLALKKTDGSACLNLHTEDNLRNR